MFLFCLFVFYCFVIVKVLDIYIGSYKHNYQFIDDAHILNFKINA